MEGGHLVPEPRLQAEPPEPTHRDRHGLRCSGNAGLGTVHLQRLFGAGQGREGSSALLTFKVYCAQGVPPGLEAQGWQWEGKARLCTGREPRWPWQDGAGAALSPAHPAPLCLQDRDQLGMLHPILHQEEGGGELIAAGEGSSRSEMGRGRSGCLEGQEVERGRGPGRLLGPTLALPPLARGLTDVSTCLLGSARPGGARDEASGPERRHADLVP